MLEAYWRATSAEIVANCFRKAHISKEVQAEEIDTGEEEPSYARPISLQLGFRCARSADL
ncbi:hypothetical protein HPB50_011316 [Hyalomma asiaticum]|uniref:Uncharacterized protein n=1 Tax=Hyalomma asiaticum TaxID=266040 RepID=A0ACB7ST82_HYAAI|nr:hypothetical protein HPB50_011316 [Hyalomma asiaticum]